MIIIVSSNYYNNNWPLVTRSQVMKLGEYLLFEVALCPANNQTHRHESLCVQLTSISGHVVVWSSCLCACGLSLATILIAYILYGETKHSVQDIKEKPGDDRYIDRWMNRVAIDERCGRTNSFSDPFETVVSKLDCCCRCCYCYHCLSTVFTISTKRARLNSFWLKLYNHEHDSCMTFNMARNILFTSLFTAGFI